MYKVQQLRATARSQQAQTVTRILRRKPTGLVVSRILLGIGQLAEVLGMPRSQSTQLHAACYSYIISLISDTHFK
jgi:hypothetical protein